VSDWPIDLEAVSRILAQDICSMPDPGCMEATLAIYEALKAVAADQKERDAQIAEHLNGWGSRGTPNVAEHIAKIIRATP
jgi:hypothetical protein